MINKYLSTCNPDVTGRLLMNIILVGEVSALLFGDILNEYAENNIMGYSHVINLSAFLNILALLTKFGVG